MRIPLHKVKPCENESEFHDYLLSFASEVGFKELSEFQEAKNIAQEILTMPHKVVFTHGDLAHHNIMVDNGHVTAFLDWESAGWYPEYWKYTTALRFVRKERWWYAFVSELGGDRYSSEQACEEALINLTSLSYTW